MNRTLIALLVGMVAAIALPGSARAQLWRAGPNTREPRASDIRCFADGRVLPAGVFFGGNRYEIQLDHCPSPNAFLVMRNIHDANDATAAVRSLRTRGLAPGYPWVVARRTIGIPGEGLAVVVGTFESSGDASAYRARFPGLDLESAARFVALEATARLEDSAGTTGDTRIVTQVVAPSAVHAYSAEDVARIDATFTGDVEARPRATYESRARAEWLRHVAAASPVCDVQPDTVFDIAIPRRDHDSSRSWSAVRCGERIAYVPRDSTNTEAIVWTHRDGRVRVTQVTLVECDCATQTTWTLDGRERTHPEHASCHGC